MITVVRRVNGEVISGHTIRGKFISEMKEMSGILTCPRTLYIRHEKICEDEEELDTLIYRICTGDSTLPSSGSEISYGDVALDRKLLDVNSKGPQISMVSDILLYEKIEDRYLRNRALYLLGIEKLDKGLQPEIYKGDNTRLIKKGCKREPLTEIKESTVDYAFLVRSIPGSDDVRVRRIEREAYNRELTIDDYVWHVFYIFFVNPYTL